MIRVTLRCFLVCMLKINIPSNVSQCPACWVINNYQWLSCHCINIPLGLEFSYRLTSFLAFGLAVKLSVTDAPSHVQMPMPRIWDRRGSCTFPACDLSNDSKISRKKTHKIFKIPCMCKTTQVLAHHLADRPNHWPWEVYESRNETQTGDDIETWKILEKLKTWHQLTASKKTEGAQHSAWLLAILLAGMAEFFKPPLKVCISGIDAVPCCTKLYLFKRGYWAKWQRKNTLKKLVARSALGCFLN